MTPSTTLAPPAGHPTAQPVGSRSDLLAALSLDELRAYRQELVTEEGRVSYWRRIVHARMDLTRTVPASRDRLREVLRSHQSDSRRLALLGSSGAAEPPPLPDLAVLWESVADDDAGRAELLTRLSAAEQQLSTYRRRLHERLDDATAELIGRYRAQPSLALRALPPGRQARAR